ncbi:uncharacterized protein si:ch211-130h14.4 isoform X3 [Rhincodon typus]|uniref:uncharacterized protein si:ch211-130h14.4 isoform X3 n=1 Tax=Rhincodon typus TaxID=259920 RepID=UPI00202EFC67|nr:uncharacterized protein si:ch211-130h14.4 isoform X3 [Rhincodon typus]
MTTHKKSTFPSLLDAYLPPQHKKQCDRGENSRLQKTGKPGKLRKHSSLGEDEEDLKMKATKKALQEQRHLEVYKNVHRLRNVMRLQYMDLLSKKVQQQRLVIKQRDLQFQRNIEEQAKKQNTSRRLFGQQSECSQFCHEIKYLKSIPKSHFYMIVELQDQLAKNGILKNQGDYEEFWHLLKRTPRASQFEAKLQDIKIKMNRSLPRFNNRLGQDLAKNPCEARKTKNHPTTTGLPGLSTFQHINHLVSKQSKVQEETEQMFPKEKVSLHLTSARSPFEVNSEAFNIFLKKKLAHTSENKKFPEVSKTSSVKTKLSSLPPTKSSLWQKSHFSEICYNLKKIPGNKSFMYWNRILKNMSILHGNKRLYIKNNNVWMDYFISSEGKPTTVSNTNNGAEEV